MSLSQSETLQSYIIDGELNNFVNLLAKLTHPDGTLDKTIYGMSLFHSIEHQQYEIFETIIKLKANLNEYHTFSFLPLHHAVDTEADSAHQHNEQPIPLFSKALLEAGADPYLKDNDGNSAADIATAYGYRKFLDLLPNRFN